jgi:hypothetical protein
MRCGYVVCVWCVGAEEDDEEDDEAEDEEEDEGKRGGKGQVVCVRSGERRHHSDEDDTRK